MLTTIRRISLQSTIALLLSCLVLVGGTAQTPRIFSVMPFLPREAKAHAAAGIEFSGWLSPNDYARGVNQITKYPGLFRTVNPVWYRAVNCTTINPLPRNFPDDISTVHRFRQAGLLVEPTVQSPMGPQETLACLSNPITRALHTTALVGTAVAHNYDGLDIDYESFIYTHNTSQMQQLRTAYNNFAADLCTKLHVVHKQCSITVMSETGGQAHVNGQAIPTIFDYPYLGKIADRVVIMAYDQNVSAPGPVAGFPWVHSVVDYAASVIPTSKLFLGIPLYGRDWWSGGMRSVKVLTMGRLKAKNTPLTFDPVEKEVTTNYNDAAGHHTVWYSDTQSVSARVQLAKQYGLRGVAFWALGQEFDDVWAPYVSKIAVTAASPRFPKHTH